MATSYITRSGQVTIVDLQDIDHITVYYLATSASENVSWNTVGWTTQTQTINNDYPYLWTYQEVVSGSNEIINKTSPVIIGTYGQDGQDGQDGQNGQDGQDGVGINSIASFYACNNSSTQPPAIEDFGTVTAIPTSANPYLWSYSTIYYTNNTTQSTTPTIVGMQGPQGIQGPQGEQGIQGPIGQNGQDGSYPISIVVLYCLSAVQPTSSTVGTTTIPEYTAADYQAESTYYKKEITTLSNNTIIDSGWVADLGLTTANRKAFRAADIADAANGRASAAETAVEAVQATAKWFIHNSSGSIVAAGREHEEPTIPFDKDTPNTYGYNTITAPGYIALRYNSTQLATFETDSLTFYRPNSAVKMLELTAGNGLKMYNPTELNQELMSLNNNILSFKDLDGHILASFGNNGIIQSGNYIRGSNNTYAQAGTQIDLINGEIFSPYFRISDGVGSGNEPAAGAYIQGIVYANEGRIGDDNTNYWYIGRYQDYLQQDSAIIKSHGTSFIQLGESNTWRLSTDRIHTGWVNDTTQETGRLHFLTASNYYWDLGLHIPDSNNNKFIYIRKASDSELLDNLITDLNDTSGGNYWDYQFYVDRDGNLYANNLYAKIGGNWTLVGGSDGTYLPISGGTITGSLAVTGTLTKGGNNVAYFTNTPVTNKIVVTNGTDGGVSVSSYTIAKSVPSDALFTDKNVQTTQANTTKLYLVGTSTSGDHTGTLNYDSNIYADITAGALHATTYNGYTLAAASTKSVDTSIAAASTSTNLPTSAAVASFVEGKGYITGFGTQNANRVYAGPTNGSAAAPTFRALVAADIPTITKSKISDFPTTMASPGTLSINVYSGTSTAATTTYTGASGASVNVAGNNAITGLGVSVDDDGASTFNITRANGGTDSFDVRIVASTASSAEMAESINTNGAKVGDTNKPVYFNAQGKPVAIDYTIATSVPSSAVFTDTKVTQTATTTSANYEVLFSATADNTTRTEGARKNSNLLFNPSTGNLQATQLNGVTIGSSPKFTDTTALTSMTGTLGTAHGGTGNTAFTANRLTYAETATKQSSAGGLSYYTGTSTASTPATYTRLHIHGTTYGNDAATMLSGTAGVFRFGDGGPQITFDTSATSGSGQAGALIFTDHDGAGTGVSFHFVSNQSPDNNGGSCTVTAPRFRARAGLTVGQNSDNTSHALYVNGSAAINGNTLKVINNSNTVTVGSQNASFTHIYNSASIPFIFNNSVLTTSGSLGSNAYPFTNVNITGGYNMLVGSTQKANMHYDSNLDAIVFSFA